MNLIDTTEVRSLATDIGKATANIEKDVDRVVERGALGIKTAMAEDAQRLTGYAKLFHRSISYDRRYRAGQIGYEIGPDKDRPQGALGNLLYFGSRNNAPQLDIEAGLAAEEPRFIQALGDVLGRAL